MSISINNTGSRFVAGKDINEGQVLIYEYSGSESTWNKIGDFTASDTGTSQDYEYVDMNSDGNIISIRGIDSSQINNLDDPTTYSPGGTKIYEYAGSGTTWNQKGGTIYGPTYGTTGYNRLNGDGTILLMGFGNYLYSHHIINQLLIYPNNFLFQYYSSSW